MHYKITAHLTAIKIISAVLALVLVVTGIIAAEIHNKKVNEEKSVSAYNISSVFSENSFSSEEILSSESSISSVSSETASVISDISSAIAEIEPEKVEIKPSTGNVFTAPEYKYDKKEDAVDNTKKNVDSDIETGDKSQIDEVKTESKNEVSSQPEAAQSSKGETPSQSADSGQTKTKYIRVTGDNVNIRDNPSVSGSKVIKCVKQNTEYAYLGELSDGNGRIWYKISIENTEGWITSEFSEIFEKAEEKKEENTSSTTESSSSSETETPKYNGWTNIDGKTYYYLNNEPLKGWKIIDGLRYHFNENTGIKDSVAGIDVSSHQGNIDWASVKNSGVEFAFIRVGYRGYETGRINIDPKFTQNIQGAQSQGIKCGVYFYSVAKDITEAVQEANFVVEAVKGYKLDLPIVIDCEHRTDRVSSLNVIDRTNNVLAFLETVKQSGYSGCLYTGHWFYQNFLNSDNLTSYQLWIAYYTDNPNRVADVPYKYWQYSSTGKINGISGNVDLDIWITG